MRTIFFVLGLVVSTVSMGSGVSRVKCESHMDMGFFSGNENGIFMFLSEPLRIAVKVGNKEELLTDAKHFCGITRNVSGYGIGVSGDINSDLEITVGSQNGEPADGGHISISADGSGVFTCPYLPAMNPQIELSNCSVQ